MLRALWITASSTKIRAPERRARAIASEGRASSVSAPALRAQPQRGVERVVLELGDDDALEAAAQLLDHALEQVVRHRPRRLHALDLQRDRVGFEDADPDRQHALAVGLAEDDRGHVRDRVDAQTLDAHLDFHG
jgi:hypothetical protein